MDLIVDFPQALCIHASPLASEQENGPAVLRGKVSFANAVKVHFIEKLSEYKEDLWYSGQDIADIQRRPGRLMRALREHGVTFEDYVRMNMQDTSAFLGLENYLSRATTLEVMRRRGAVKAAVRYEQRRQNEMGVRDFDTMAHVASEASLWSRKRARTIALLHA